MSIGQGVLGGNTPKMSFPIGLLIRTTLTTVLHYRADCETVYKISSYAMSDWSVQNLLDGDIINNISSHQLSGAQLARPLINIHSRMLTQWPTCVQIRIYVTIFLLRRHPYAMHSRIFILQQLFILAQTPMLKRLLRQCLVPLLYNGHFYRATEKHTHGLAVDICLSVRLSVCLSNACNVTKWKHLAKKFSYD